MIGLITFLLMLLGGCFGFTFFAVQAPSVEVSPPTTVPLEIVSSSGTAMLLLIENDSFSDEELERTFAGIERRLSMSGFGGGMVSTFGEQCFEVHVYNDEVIPQDLYPLYAPGIVELVDFSDIPDAQQLAGTIISTTGAEREGRAINPNTGEPFETVISGEQMESAVAQLSDFNQSWMVAFELTPDGAEIFGTFTESHIGQPLAIVYEGMVRSVPIIQSRLDSSGIITGNFTEDEAEALALQLNTGAIPLSLELLGLDVLTSGSSSFAEQDFAIDGCS